MSSLSKTERGFIDRVDGYEHEGKLYLRVIDYKTRKKAYSFELSDVLNGRDMQMLIYLFALKNYGAKKYGREIEPGGILYIPAREVTLSTTRNASDEDIQKKRTNDMRRSGLVLNDPAVIDAMENGPYKDYLPVKTTKDGDFTGDSLVTAKQIELLSKHVGNMIKSARKSISNGVTECKPYYKSENDNACNYCDYHEICGFDEAIGDKHSYFSKKSNEEVWKDLETGKST
jgi:ATP-dependent helicase/nuclease subunit B